MTILKNKNHFLVALLSACLYIFLAYFLKREQFVPLLVVVAILFGSFTYFINHKTLSAKYLFQFGLIFRSVFLLSTPFLSQDFYRFIWDGRLIMQHVSPFEFTPDSIINTTTISQARQLFDGMGNLSAGHYSNYPPFNQMFFASAALFSSKSILGSIIILRLEIIASDVAIYFLGKSILKRLSLNQNAIFLYFLNPLVIIELSGNLHFEGVMLCFFLCGIYFLIQKKIAAAAIFIALSISTKLLPLMLLPIFFKYLGWQKSVLFYIVIIVLNIIFFLPFFSIYLVDHYLNTISLWFVNFEFNASFYYIVKAIGFYFKGYNIIGSVAKVTPILLILFIAFVSFYKNNKTTDKLMTSSLVILTIYFLLATTVHPWYVINLVLISCFTKFRFAVIWSFTIFLSYYAYSNKQFKENLLLLIIEYTIVFAFIFYELYYKDVQNKNFKKISW